MTFPIKKSKPLNYKTLDHFTLKVNGEICENPNKRKEKENLILQRKEKIVTQVFLLFLPKKLSIPSFFLFHLFIKVI